ncbi:MAG: hypothetical protein JOY80_10755 [Candidatus Dormibacteraeota bacterium]|nr:hypothetical protein [Candidatus Dormibacteraeota bacterium]
MMTIRKGLARRSLAVLAVLGGAMATGAHPAHAQSTNPACSYLFYDAGADAPDNSGGTTGPQQANLDIVEGDMGLSADGTTLRTVLTLANQDFSFSNTGPFIDYQVVFAFGTNAQTGNPNLFATDVSLGHNPNGAPLEMFDFGVFQGISTSTTGLLFTQFVFTNTVTGRVTSGAGGQGAAGQVEADVPLSDITVGGSTPPKVGDTLTMTQGFSASGQGTEGGGNEFISDQDPSTKSGDPLGTVGHNYTIGQATCVSAAFVQPGNGTPEAPLTALLIATGVGATGAGVALRRRRKRATTPTTG